MTSSTAQFLANKCLIFGGSFDPPHLGHWLMLEVACQIFTSEKHASHAPQRLQVIVVPSYEVVPIATDRKAYWASFQDRLHMCKLLFEGQASAAHVEVSDCESILATPSYTIQTLRFLSEHLAKSQDSQAAQPPFFRMILGMDQWAQFHLWKSPIDVLRLTEIVLFDRSVGEQGLCEEYARNFDCEIFWESAPKKAEIKPEIKVEGMATGLSGKDFPAFQLHIGRVQHRGEAISRVYLIKDFDANIQGRTIRRLIKDTERSDKAHEWTDMVSPKVAQYIKEKSLYV